MQAGRPGRAPLLDPPWEAASPIRLWPGPYAYGLGRTPTRPGREIEFNLNVCEIEVDPEVELRSIWM